MRRLLCVCLGVALASSVVQAGQIYGSVISAGKGLANAAIQIDCAGAVSKGTTAGDGAYRIDVPAQGQCTLTLVDYKGASAVVYSYPDPSQYNFELVNNNGNYQLRRR